MSAATAPMKKAPREVQLADAVTSTLSKEKKMTTTVQEGPDAGTAVRDSAPPADVPVPEWATDTSTWTHDGPSGWVRWVKRPYCGFSLELTQSVGEDGNLVEQDLSIQVDTVEIFGAKDEQASDAREMASDLHAVADLLAGPPPWGERGRAGRLQQQVAARVQRTIAASRLRQNEMAVAAGYGPDEFSTFMTGRRLMDLNDVERIAGALGVDPFDLLGGLS